MSTVEEKNNPEKDDHGAVTGVRSRLAAALGWSIYRQVAAIFAAFGLTALLGHFWQIGWKGFLAIMVGVWSDTVRPVMTWTCHILVTVPLGWVGMVVEVPLWIRDYLSVGLVLVFSMFRILRTEVAVRPGSESEMLIASAIWPLRVRQGESAFEYISGRLLMWPPLLIIAWPVAIGAVFLWILYSFAPSRKGQYLPRNMLLFLSPLIYLCLLFATNYWLL